MHSDSEYRPEALASAVSKIKARTLPIFIILFIANYIDRVNVSFVAKYLERDLDVDAQIYGIGAGIFFCGYAIFEVPSNLMMQRYGARVWITRIAITWGLAAAAMAFIQNGMQFLVLRFFLGVAEAGFFPAVIYYFTFWLPSAERGRAVALFLSGSAIAAIISGPLNGLLVEFKELGLQGWQWMFLFEGMLSVALSALVWFCLDSKPRDARWLTDEEKDALEQTIAKEQARREAQQTEKPGWLTLVKDYRIVLFCLIYFAIQLTIYAATFWLPKIIQKMGKLTDLQVGFYNSIPWVIAMIAMYIFAAAAARWKFQQAWVAVALLTAAIGMFLSTQGNAVFAFVSICFAAIGFKSASSLFWPIPQGYLDARISAAAIALINSLGNLGGFVAPATFGILEKQTGSINGGLYGLSVASLIAAVLVFFTRTQTAVTAGDANASPMVKRASV